MRWEPAKGSRRVNKNRRGSESPLVYRSTAPIDQQVPVSHTSAELEAIMGLLTERRSRVSTISVGHARDDASRSAANAIIRAWTVHGGGVLGVVDWPEDAASWLRQATRLAVGAPDAWVVAGPPLGWAQMGRRLRCSTDWDAERTIAFSSLADIQLIELAARTSSRACVARCPMAGPGASEAVCSSTTLHKTSTAGQQGGPSHHEHVGPQDPGRAGGSHRR